MVSKGRNGSALLLPTGEPAAFPGGEAVATVTIAVRKDGQIVVTSDELDPANIGLLIDKAKLMLMNAAPISLKPPPETGRDAGGGGG